MNNRTQHGYRIVREWKRDSRIVDVMETSSFASEEAAKLWFSEYIHTMLSKDTSGNYRQEIYTPVGDGMFLDECSGLIEDELPEWWQGCGIYDESENLVFGYNYAQKCPIDLIISFDDGNYIYRMERDD